MFSRSDFTKNTAFKSYALRYERAAAAGFHLVEVSLPYSEMAENLALAAKRSGLQHVLINAPAGDWSEGFRGIAALASQREAFKESIVVAIKYAKVLECTRIHVMAGIPVSEEDLKLASMVFRENIQYAAGLMHKNDLTCLIEPINPRTIPGYFLNDYRKALDVLAAVNCQSLKLQYDLFHAAQITSHTLESARQWSDKIGHIQVAQVPHRDEPDNQGSVDYGSEFEWIKKSGRDWIIGAEYSPTTSDANSVGWIKKYGLDF